MNIRLTPLVSVIVPIYNVEEYLKECIDSIIGQTYRHLEIILVDDGSPDRCGKVCDEYALSDGRVRVIHQSNRGLSAARNAGLEMATGEFISFIDSDDYLDKHFYARLLEAFEGHPEVGITACMIYRDEQGRIISSKSSWHMDTPTIYSYEHCCEGAILGKLPVAVWNKLYRAELIGKLRFKEGRIVEDVLYMYDLSLEVKKQQMSLLQIPDYLYYYRIREGSICHCDVPILPESIRCRMEIAQASRAVNPDFSRKISMMVNRKILVFNIQMESNKEWKRRYASSFRPLLKQVPIKEIFVYDVGLRYKLALLVIRVFPRLYPVLRRMKRTFVKCVQFILSRSSDNSLLM